MNKMALALVVLLTGSINVAASTQEKNAPATAFQEQLAKARNGDVVAQNEVGILYAEGRGVAQDISEGMRWFERSAEQGNARAACNLGLHYAKGWGVRKDVVEAVKWFGVGYLLDPLSCFVGEDDVVPLFGAAPTRTQLERGNKLAVDWLKTRPTLRNNFGERPWLEDGRN